MKRLLAAATACLLTTSAVWAQTPVNFPPSSYQGRQFVDNNGCIFIRAGVGDAVTWVPRMTRSRTPICNQTPTFGGGGATDVAAAPKPQAPVAKPTPKPTPKPKATVVAKPAPAPRVAAKPAPATRPAPVAVAKPRVTTRKPTPTVASTVATVTTAQAAPKPVAQVPPKAARRAPTPAPTIASGSTACTNAPRSSQRYINRDGVRCGPQQSSIVTVVRRSGGVPASNPANPVAQPTVPKGYKPVWTDDRLNPKRGLRTPAGNAQSAKSWTQKPPRKMIAVPAAAARPAPVAAPSSGRYVQVATFGVPNNAQRTAARFQAAGLPVRILKNRAGQQMVLVGAPAGGSISATLSAARRAGFSDAFIR